MSTGLSPNDIRNCEFAHQMRGYDKDEVRQFLERVAVVLEDLKQQNLKVSMERDTLRTQLDALKQFEDTIKSAAIDARRNADSLVTTAKREVDETLNKARSQAEEIVGSRKNEAARLDEQISRLQMTKASYQSKLKNLIESHLGLIEEIQKIQAPVIPGHETPAAAPSGAATTVSKTAHEVPPGLVAAEATAVKPAPKAAKAPRPTPTPTVRETEHPDPFGLSAATAHHTDPETDFSSTWSGAPSHPANNGIEVEESTDVTRKKIETFSTEPEPAEPVQPEEANAPDRIIAVEPPPTPTPTPAAPTLDPELAAALASYQQAHAAASELVRAQPKPPSQPPVDQSMRAIPNDLDERNATDKITTEASPEEPHDNTEHNRIDIDQPIGSEKVARVKAPVNLDAESIARELDEVAARFEEEMDRAAKS